MDKDETKTAASILKMFFGETEAGREMQQRINDLVPSIIYIYDVNKKKLSYVNKKITDILGYEYDEVDSWDDHLSNLVFKDDTAVVKEALDKLNTLADDETHTYKTRLNHKKGNWKYFRTTGSVLKRNEQGAAESLLFIAEDITHTIETEEEIQAKNELINEMEELLQFGTWNWDMRSNKLLWSEGLYKLLGYSRDTLNEVTHEFYLGHVARADLSALQEKIKALVETKTPLEHIYNITTKGGQEKIVSTNAKPIVSPEGELIKVIGTTRDVTEQINAYRELFYYKQMTLEKEQFLESGSWELDVATGKLSWSDGMFRLFGYDPKDKDLTELTNEFYYTHHQPQQVERIKSEWESIIREKDNYISEEIITDNNGKTKRLETYGKIIRNSDGMAVKVMGTTKDVTQLKDYERQLEKKLFELERSNRDLEEFAYVASHDLQEPLRKISTFSERLRLKFDGELGEDGNTYITRMLNAAANMRMLIENLLDFSRITSKEVYFETVDIDTLFNEVIAELELQVDESHATIQKGKLPVLEVMPSQIKQLFSNIILNAIKFRKPGVAPVIRVNSRPVTLQEKEEQLLHKNIDYHAITIQDNGIGFEQEYAEKIFYIFQRLHGKAEYPGAGIGLAICKKIAENHRGKLFAKGTPGEGAAFIVILPEKNNY